MEPSKFYTGLVADLYAALRGHVYDNPEPWRRFIAEVGEPALELAAVTAILCWPCGSKGWTSRGGQLPGHAEALPSGCR